uniref:NADH-ubiquinone oxidoreductase chain 6 n=1 Tax=Languriidae sp. KM-2017 TaxID=2219440 RepID=A0A346RIZ1_9CUCU|nr:NADH dehydrogenase subunit 6 [Languriidae sp. KM-2017]
MSLFILLMWTLSFMFMFLNHPLSFGFILLLQTILISLITGSMTLNYWYSYIIFLIMIGGMLVLFIYMTSIASNEKFKFSPKLFLFFMMMMMIIFLALFIDPFIFNFLSSNYEFKMFEKIPNFVYSMTKYMNFPTNSIFLMMIIYLFITLIAVVKITNINYGPLRQKS